jgi:hypothetical protein
VLPFFVLTYKEEIGRFKIIYSADPPKSLIPGACEGGQSTTDPERGTNKQQQQPKHYMTLLEEPKTKDI